MKHQLIERQEKRRESQSVYGVGSVDVWPTIGRVMEYCWTGADHCARRYVEHSVTVLVPLLSIQLRHLGEVEKGDVLESPCRSLPRPD